MTTRIFMALFIAALFAIQPAFAEDSVVTLDLEYATDEELAGALGAATELELIMRTDLELYAEGESAPAADAAEGIAPVAITEEIYAAEGIAPAAITEEIYAAEEIAPAAITEEIYAAEEIVPVAVTDEIHAAEGVLSSLLNDEYFLESQRLLGLANEAYEQGDYEAAALYAQEASRYAQLSEEYVARAVAAAVAPTASGYPLPATFTVRSWIVYRDSLWTIAGRPEILGDPYLWPLLFDANRRNMPNPNNPNLILPGMVLEIPSIDGETREGAWQSSREYNR